MFLLAACHVEHGGTMKLPCARVLEGVACCAINHLYVHKNINSAKVTHVDDSALACMRARLERAHEWDKSQT